MILAADYKQVYIYDARRKTVKQVLDMDMEEEMEPSDVPTEHLALCCTMSLRTWRAWY